MTQPGFATTLTVDGQVYAVMSSRSTYRGRTYVGHVIQAYPVKPNHDSLEWIRRNVELAKQVIGGDQEAINGHKADVLEAKKYYQFKYAQTRVI